MARQQQTHRDKPERFDETAGQLSEPVEDTDTESSGVGGIRTPAGKRSGPGGSTSETENTAGLTTGSDMGTADESGGTR